jgi:membrane protein DedA with SNARE-associated domain
VNPFLIYFVVVAGDLTGDFMWYAAGRWGRHVVDWKWSRYFGITPVRLARVEQHFEKHSGKTLLLGKVTQGVGALILVGAGAARMRAGRFVAFNLIATLPKSLALLLFGYYFGKAYAQASSALDYAALVSVLVVVLAVMAYVIPRRFAGRLQ